MSVAIVGLGYWGPNLLRTFTMLSATLAAFDRDQERIVQYETAPSYKHVFFDTDWEKCLGRQDVSGVVIATPPDTHHGIAKKALQAGKHVFIEKPMTLVVEEAEELCEIAQEYNKYILVGHIFLYSPEIRKLKEVITDPAFGEVLYIYSQRLNLGKIQSQANVIQDLAPHDISIVNYLLDDVCEEVQTFGKSHIIDTEDVAFINMRYKKGVICNLHLSWLDPLKVRSMVVVGTKQMVFCDSGSKRIELYNKRVDINKRQNVSNKSYAAHLMSYRYGDVIIPYIDAYEPMMEECKDFIDCMTTDVPPLSGAGSGLEVVKTLVGMQTSLINNGRWISV